MRALSTLSSLVTLLSSARAVASSPDAQRDHGRDCLSDKEANTLLNQWVSLFEKLDVDLAERILTPDFQQFSSSLNFLSGLDVRRP